ncbi:hypothetical protein SAMN02745176_01325 [Lutispora thermophila DSM 19022]|uniref:Uncharacterized protein n=1 Tax=Lutispora thermophila DSM 19022 TaxID=1122184 RepID=A0A1M6DVY9_9FIRM|nr:hypothetical protein SAMN02745176_01325 [Lutispora thermophila DSM 19022]
MLIKPSIKYPITATAPHTRAYGNCVLTWSIWSAADPVEASIVVSDNGEQWSPNTPPPATAAKQADTNNVASPPVKVNAKGNAIGIQIAKVPQDDPVAKDIIAAITKIIAGNNCGLSIPLLI